VTRLQRREDDRVAEEPRAEDEEAAGDEVQARVVPPGEQAADRSLREEVEVRWILLGLAAREKAQPMSSTRRPGPPT
jgi:hypothetical protein